jgi:4-amino-4-deoxy-L-arabinose transferase-like glycosyltransferase
MGKRGTKRGAVERGVVAADEQTPSSLTRRQAVMLLALILMVAGTLRLVNLGQSPPGLNVDEAANAWNAYCISKTGTDQHAVAWPIFHARMFGDADNRSTLFLYFLQPFVFLGGLKIETIRVAGAISGLITILLIYAVGSRLFGRVTGILAAGLLCLNPWHLQQSRWAHEATLTPLLILSSLAALLWTNLPFDGKDRRPRLVMSVVAGVVVGVSCYGYQSVRIFLPVFLTGAVLLSRRNWWDILRTRRGSLAAVLLLLTVTAFFLPLAWKHLTDPSLSGRARITWVWDESDSALEKAGKVMGRYPGHFSPDFLFLTGDSYPALSPPAGYGLFHWYALPLMLLGLAEVWKTRKTSAAGRLLFLWILLYPIGDLLSRHPGPHALRSLPGLCGLILLAAWGAAGSGSWLWQRRRSIAFVTMIAFGIAVAGINASFLQKFFGAFNRDMKNYYFYHPDMIAAFDWLRPRLDSVDAVFCTVSNVPHPYIYALVGLGYAPDQWFRDVRHVVKGPLQNGMHPYEDVCLRFGRLYFLYPEVARSALKDLRENGRPDRAFFIVRPGQLEAGNQGLRLLHEILSPQGKPSLQVYEASI